VRCICGSAPLLITAAVPLAQNRPPGVRAISRWSAQMGILQRSRRIEPAKNAPTILHFSFLNTVESTVIKAEIAHRSRVQGIWSTADDL
jgi:hypothetical protein